MCLFMRARDSYIFVCKFVCVCMCVRMCVCVGAHVQCVHVVQPHTRFPGVRSVFLAC